MTSFPLLSFFELVAQDGEKMQVTETGSDFTARGTNWEGSEMSGGRRI